MKKQTLREFFATLPPLARTGAVLLGVTMVIATVGEAEAQYAPVDMVLNSLRTQSRGWMTHMLGPARNLAMGLGLIQFAWSAIKMGLSPNMGLQSAIELAFKQLMFVGFAIALIQFAPTWMPAIVDSVQELGRGATGRAVAMTPQRVVQVGVEIFVTVYRSYTEINPLLMLPIAGLLIILFILYLVLAAMMTLAIAQVYMVMGAGVFLLGFQGSTWTQDLARGYLRYLLAAGVKLMVVTLIVSVGETQVTMWVGLATSAEGLGGSVEMLLVAVSSVAIVAVMVATLPEYAAAMITGSTGFGGEAMVLGAAAMAAGAAASAASGGASGAASGAAGSGGAGSGKAVEAATQVGRGGGSSPPLDGGSSNSGSLVSGGAGYTDLQPDAEGEAEGFLGPLDEDADAADGQGSTEAETSRPDPGQPTPSSADSEDPESAPGPAGGATTAAEGAKVSSAAGDRSSSGGNAAASSGSGRMKGAAATGAARRIAGRAGIAGAASRGGGDAGGADDSEEDDDE